jgi:predicted RNA-binding protein with PIN domain
VVAPGPARWLIDGNNVMGSRPDGWWRDRRGAARRLVAELERHPWPEGAEVTVIFDGPGWGPEPEGAEHQTVVQVVHAGRHRSADDAIVEAAGRQGSAVVVVTSDRGLRDRVRALGAEIVPSRSLLDRLGRGQRDGSH